MQSASARRVFAPGERIFTEGDAPDVAYLIESGRIEIWASQGARRLTLSYLGAGEILGEMAVIDRVRARKKKGAPCEAPLPVSTDRF